MARDFRAGQVVTSKIIASGANNGTKIGLLIYSGTDSSNTTGGVQSDMLTNVGSDVYIFVSGSKGGRDETIDGHNDVVLFGGDVVISGTMYAEKLVAEVDEITTGSLSVSGSLFVSQSVEVGEGLSVNIKQGDTPQADTQIKSANRTHAFFVDASTDQIFILSGTANDAASETNEAAATDLAFFVSGTKDSKDSTDNKGTALFGGDLVVSGTLHSEASISIAEDLTVLGNTYLSGSVSDFALTGTIKSSVTPVIASSVATEISTAAGAITIDGNAGIDLQEDGTNVISIDTNRDVLFSETGGDTSDPDVKFDGYTKFDGAAEFDSTVQFDENVTINNDLYLSGSVSDFALTGTIKSSGTPVIASSVATEISTDAGAITIDGKEGLILQEDGTDVIAIDTNRDVLFSETGGGTSDPDVEFAGYTKFVGAAEFDSTAQFDENVTVNNNLYLSGNVSDFIATGSVTITSASKTTIIGSEQVLILSGGSSGGSEDEAAATDLVFFVSGAEGSKDSTTTRGVSLFGGDTVVSGVLYTQTIQSRIFQAQAPIDDSHILVPSGVALTISGGCGYDATGFGDLIAAPIDIRAGGSTAFVNPIRFLRGEDAVPQAAPLTQARVFAEFDMGNAYKMFPAPGFPFTDPNTSAGSSYISGAFQFAGYYNEGESSAAIYSPSTGEDLYIAMELTGSRGAVRFGYGAAGYGGNMGQSTFCGNVLIGPDDPADAQTKNLYFYDVPGSGGEYIHGDSYNLVLNADGSLILSASQDVMIPGGVGITFGHGQHEKIESDNTDLTIRSGHDINLAAGAGGDINLTATDDVVIPVNVGLVFGDGGENIETNNTDLTINSGGDIDLTVTTNVNIPSGKGLTFGADTEKISGASNDLTIAAATDINLSPGTAVTIPVNKALYFDGTSGDDQISSDGSNITYDSNGYHIMSGSSGVRIQQGSRLILDAADKCEISVDTGDNLTIKTTDGHATRAGDVVLQAQRGIVLNARGNNTTGSVFFRDGSTQYLLIKQNSDNCEISSSIHNADIIFRGNALAPDSTGQEVFRIDSSTRTLSVPGNTHLQGSVFISGSVSDFTTTGTIKVSPGNAPGLSGEGTATTTATVIDIQPDGLTTGTGISVASNSSDGSERNLVFIGNEHGSATQTTLLKIQNDAAPSVEHIPPFLLKQTADTTNPTMIIQTGPAASATSPPHIQFHKAAAGGAVDDGELGKLAFVSPNAGSNNRTFASMDVISSDVTADNESAKFTFNVYSADPDGHGSGLVDLLSIGGADVANSTPAAVVINDAAADCGFRVETSSSIGKTGAILVDAGTGQMGLLTKGTTAANAYADNVSATGRAIPDDVAIFVSGAIAGKDVESGADSKGTSVFGGDLVISGVIYGMGPADIGGLVLGSTYDFSVIGTDTYNWISGSTGRRGSTTNRGTSVFGGDIMHSGAIYGTAEPGNNPGVQSGWEDNLYLYADGQFVAQSYQTLFYDKFNAEFGGGGFGIKGYEAGNDTFFYVSGGIGRAGNDGAETYDVAVFGGDTVISGAFYPQGGLYSRAEFPVSGALINLGSSNTGVAAAGANLRQDTRAGTITATLGANMTSDGSSTDAGYFNLWSTELKETDVIIITTAGIPVAAGGDSETFLSVSAVAVADNYMDIGAGAGAEIDIVNTTGTQVNSGQSVKFNWVAI